MHNYYRNLLVQGLAQNSDGTYLDKAINMNPIVKYFLLQSFILRYFQSYSQALEAEAQQWANQCNFNHNRYGQNLHKHWVGSPYNNIPQDQGK